MFYNFQLFEFGPKFPLLLQYIIFTFAKFIKKAIKKPEG